MADKIRLDSLLVERGFAPARERAKRLIMAGVVLVDNRKIDKAGTLVPADAKIRILGEDIPYVSRGGLKLAKAVECFGLDLKGKTALDIGASTGGFTDCMLQNGAAKVYAIDVGYGQLAWKLRNDLRVVNMERTNIRNVTPDLISESADFASVDVAFISLTKVLPVLKELLSADGEAVALIKPQFEAGREKVGKRGVVKDSAVHIEVVASIVSFVQDEGWRVKGLTFSPVKGPEGNIEYLLWLDRGGASAFAPSEINSVVEAAHRELDR